MALEPGEPFLGVALPDGVRAVTVETSAGQLTALHVPARGVRRGRALFIPGFTGSREDFIDVMLRLARDGYECLSYSQRGQADADAPPGIDAYTLSHFAADAADVAIEWSAHQPVHLVGHSFGGIVARAAVLSYPHCWASMTMLCSGPRGTGPRYGEDLAERLAARGGLALWVEDATTEPLPVHADRDAIADRRTLARLERRDLKRARLQVSSRDNLLSVARIIERVHDVTESLRTSRVPVLVAHGEHDDVWPIEWQREGARLAGAAYAVLPDAAHDPAHENPGELVAVLEAFWSGELRGAVPR